jgi:diguanylate cyclase (GGDEF)-like protein/PAS domain S-box-containing protein
MDESGFGAERRYRDLVEMAGDFAWEIDATSRFIFASPRLVFGWAAQDLLGRRVADFLADPAASRHFAVSAPLSHPEIRFRGADGTIVGLSLSARPVFDLPGLWWGARGFARAHDALGHELALNEARIRDSVLQHVVRAVRDENQPEETLAAALAALGLAIGAAGGAVLRLGAEAAKRPPITWGAKPPPAAIAAARTALAERDSASAHAAGCQLVAHRVHYHHEAKGVALLWRRVEEQSFADFDRALLGAAADHLGIVLAQIEARERINMLSRTDPLTTLTNRGAFFDEFARRMLRLDRGTQFAALLYIDVDNLKLVNDRHGPSAGDEALVSLAGILRDNTRAGDLIARFGGDEFVIWIEGIDERGAARRIAAIEGAATRLASLSGSIERPFGIAVGLAMFNPLRPETPVQLIGRASAAAQRHPQKQQGGNLAATSLSA